MVPIFSTGQYSNWCSSDLNKWRSCLVAGFVTDLHACCTAAARAKPALPLYRFGSAFGRVVDTRWNGLWNEYYLLTSTTLWITADEKLVIFSYLPQKTIGMKCQSLYVLSGENQKKISAICRRQFAWNAKRRFSEENEVKISVCCITKTRLFKYTENFTTTKWQISDKKILIFFLYFCSKHRLWIHVRTASARRF